MHAPEAPRGTRVSRVRCPFPLGPRSADHRPQPRERSRDGSRLSALEFTGRCPDPQHGNSRGRLSSNARHRSGHPLFRCEAPMRRLREAVHLLRRRAEVLVRGPRLSTGVRLCPLCRLSEEAAGCRIEAARYEELFQLQERTPGENLELAECALSFVEAGVFGNRQIERVRSALKQAPSDPKVQALWQRVHALEGGG
jgi:hypothetical protein